jgi:ABC-type multidrug transport system fused ATPase/permease subunit
MKTEGDIMNNLKEIGRDTTCVIIAHRLSTVQDCDLIVVMENGTVVEIGNHDELAIRGGRYSEMLRFQKSLDTTETTSVDDVSNSSTFDYASV